MNLEFDGTNYHGWQQQPNAITVQEVLDNALTTLLGTDISVTGAGRTDAGVHATEMVAHFDYADVINEDTLRYKLNSYLPSDIAIQKIYKVNSDAHARFDAVSRSYVYKLHQRKDVFLNKRSYFLHQALNLNLMNEACNQLLQHSDFECFSKTHTDVKTFICDITSAQWVHHGHRIEFHITADRFLRNMVRAIVGTMINIGLGKLSLQGLEEVLASKDRSKAGYSVPAHGLYLSEVVYPESIYPNSDKQNATHTKSA